MEDVSRILPWPAAADPNNTTQNNKKKTQPTNQTKTRQKDNLLYLL